MLLLMLGIGTTVGTHSKCLWAKGHLYSWGQCPPSQMYTLFHSVAHLPSTPLWTQCLPLPRYLSSISVKTGRQLPTKISMVILGRADLGGHHNSMLGRSAFVSCVWFVFWRSALLFPWPRKQNVYIYTCSWFLLNQCRFTSLLNQQYTWFIVLNAHVHVHLLKSANKASLELYI